MNSKENHCEQRRKEKDLWTHCRVRAAAADRCPEADLLAAYLDHRLSQTEKHDIEAHLVTCPSCLDTIVFLGQIDEDLLSPVAEKDLRAACHLVAPDVSPRAGIRRRIARWLFPLPLQPVFAPVLLIAVCMAGFYLGNRTGADQLFVRHAMAAELQFGLVQSLTNSDADGEDG